MCDRIVIALGGNALGDTPAEQIKRAAHAAVSLVDLIEKGYEIVISHGNGPQVGMISLAFDEGSAANAKIPAMPLSECSAMSQGYIGFHLQNAVLREMKNRGMPWQAVTVVTQVEVDATDKAFANPTKPIGPYYTESQAKELMKENPGSVYAEDAGRGYRRMVASPVPIDIVEKDAIDALLSDEFVVIACGGGGIPVIKKATGEYESICAVIDKDFASEKLAELVGATHFIILTAVERVALNFGKENQTELSEITPEEARRYCDEGHFAPGSMLPKVKAAIAFAESGKGRKAIIASLEKSALALSGESGTVICAK